MNPFPRDKKENFAAAGVNDGIAKMQAEWSAKFRSMKKRISSSIPPQPVSPVSWNDSSRYSFPANAEFFSDAKYEELKREVRAVSEQCAQLKNQGISELRRISDQVERFDGRIHSIEKQFSEYGQTISEIQKIDSSIKEARQKQYEMFVDDRGKLRLDYLDLKQEVTQKMKIMQMRLEDLISANAARAAGFSDPTEAAMNDLSHLSSLSGQPEEKGFFQRMIEWWSEPVVTFSGSGDSKKQVGPGA